MAKGKVVTRMLAVFTAIQGGRQYTTAELASKMNVSTRTIFRDLSQLQEAGFPIYFDSQRRTYRLTDNFQMRPLHVTSEELGTLVAALSYMRRRGSSAARKPVSALMDKLLATLPQQQREEAGEMDRVIAVDPIGAHGVEDEKVVRALEHALAQHRKVQIRYAAFVRAGEESLRVVRPYGLVYRGTSRYLIGYCEERADIRTFRVGRVRAITLLEQRFAIPADFSLDSYLSGLWGITEGPQTHVRLRFAPGVAQLALETQWHPTQQVMREEDGGVIMTMTTRGPAELSRWIAGYGGAIQVLEPASLKEAVVALARGVLAGHGGG